MIKRLFIVMMLLLPLATALPAQDKNDPKYLAGAVPLKNGFVIFDKTYKVSGKSKSELFRDLKAYAETLVKGGEQPAAVAHCRGRQRAGSLGLAHGGDPLFPQDGVGDAQHAPVLRTHLHRRRRAVHRRDAPHSTLDRVLVEGRRALFLHGRGVDYRRGGSVEGRQEAAARAAGASAVSPSTARRDIPRRGPRHRCHPEAQGHSGNRGRGVMPSTAYQRKAIGARRLPFAVLV